MSRFKLWTQATLILCALPLVCFLLALAYCSLLLLKGLRLSLDLAGELLDSFPEAEAQPVFIQESEPPVFIQQIFYQPQFLTQVVIQDNEHHSFEQLYSSSPVTVQS